jgi:hypothetical protein
MKDDLAETINILLGMRPPKTQTGRAIQRTLSFAMWSPKLTSSRLLTPGQIITNPTMRWYVAGVLSSYIGSGLAIMAAAATVGTILNKRLKKKTTVEWNPLSSDFGKVKIGNTRFDVFGDGGPYIRLFCRFLVGEMKTQAGRRRDAPRWQTVYQFAKNKRHPLWNFLHKITTGKTMFGEKVWEKPGKHLALDTFAPFMVQSMVDAALEDGWVVGLLAGMDEFMSGQVQTYKERSHVKAQKLQDELAQEQYGAKWEELGPRAQKRIRDKTPDMGRHEQRARYERFEAEYAGTEERAKKAASYVFGKLPAEVRQEMERLNVPVQALSRATETIKSGGKQYKWSLNDERYQRYQDLAAEKITETLTTRLKTRTYRTANDRGRRRQLERAITAALGRARTEIKIEANKADDKRKKKTRPI